MYPGRALTLTSMIGRINRTLNFANQVIYESKTNG